MTPFATLLSTLDTPAGTAAKTAALASYFSTAPDSDKLWAIALLSGHRPKRAATTTELRTWACEIAGIPDWLFQASHTLVGDLAETIAHILPPPRQRSTNTLTDIISTLLTLPGQPVTIRRADISNLWDSLSPDDRFIFNKLTTGSFRTGVSQGMMARALSQTTGIDAPTLAHRLIENWTPQTSTFHSLICEGEVGTKPYPFALASDLNAAPETLGAPADWIAELKWDGIRCQLIQRPTTFALWSRGEELITHRFPEFAALADFLPHDTVIDAEILTWSNGGPRPWATQKARPTRVAFSKKLFADFPARLMAHDLLEENGQDLRSLALSERRDRLARIIKILPDSLPITLSPTLNFDDWKNLANQRASSREKHAEALMLRRAASPYPVDDLHGDWWQWKLEPFSVDAVLIYAQAGQGSQAKQHGIYTFAIRDGNDLVPFTKADAGLTDVEFDQIAQWVSKYMLERFGPVRKVPPQLVFEIGFDGIQASPRHKSGIVLRNPRIVRWLHDKTVDQIDTLDNLRALLPAPASVPPPELQSI